MVGAVKCMLSFMAVNGKLGLNWLCNSEHKFKMKVT